MTLATAPSATSPILEVHGLSRSFGGVRVIEKLDLAVAGGEIVGLLGPNGAGKSTLFNPSPGSFRLMSAPLRIKLATSAG
jgi:ABC-type branched-subunit amino acid transport system ATPase component